MKPEDAVGYALIALLVVGGGGVFYDGFGGGVVQGTVIASTQYDAGAVSLSNGVTGTLTGYNLTVGWHGLTMRNLQVTCPLYPVGGQIPVFHWPGWWGTNPSITSTTLPQGCQESSGQ